MKKFFLPLALSVAAGAVAVAPAFAQSNLRTVQSIPVQSEAYQLVAQSGNREQMSAIKILSKWWQRAILKARRSF
jgi:hypothetical protein